MVGHRSLEFRERSLPEMRLRQIQHLDGFKAIELDKVPTRMCAAREDRGSDTAPWGSAKVTVGRPEKPSWRWEEKKMFYPGAQ